MSFACVYHCTLNDFTLKRYLFSFQWGRGGSNLYPSQPKGPPLYLFTDRRRLETLFWVLPTDD
nr:MAG TPA: hypothetical protein [Caudoviricetes sp.]